MPIGGILSTVLAAPAAALTLVGGAGGGGVPLLGGGGAGGEVGPVGAGGPVTQTGGGFDIGGIVGMLVGLPFDTLGTVLDLVGGQTGIFGTTNGNGNGNLATNIRLPVDTTGFGGGNGSRSTRTIVETMDLRTGQIVSRKMLPGSPHIMNSEIKAAKKVFRQSQKLHSRLPSRTRRQSKATQLKEAAIDAAMANVNCPPQGCAPKC